MADTKIFASIVDDVTKQQVRALGESDAYRDCVIRVMPDCHAGKGCTIGTVIKFHDRVVPNTTGVDIGCGMLVKHVSEWIGCIEHDLKISSKDVESEEELAMFKAGLAYLEKQKDPLTPEEKMNHPLYLEGFDVGKQVGEVVAKPTEWSEGTKKALDEISDYLKYKGREEDADFIRHLCPQPHWKPSEEQIISVEELEYFIETELHKDEFIRKWPQYEFHVPDHREGDEYSSGVAVGVGRAINALKNFITNKIAEHDSK